MPPVADLVALLVSFAVRIGERLTETIAAQTAEAAAVSGGGSLLPVLASRTDAVEQAVAAAFPSLVQRSGGRASDAAGWASGRAAADLASLHTRSPLPQESA